jgi:hypothetical protein
VVSGCGVSIATCLVENEFWYPRYVVTGLQSWVDVVNYHVETVGKHARNAFVQ